MAQSPLLCYVYNDFLSMKVDDTELDNIQQMYYNQYTVYVYTEN